MKIITAGFIVFLIFTFFCCSSQKADWQGTIEEIDGVTVVKNPKEPMFEEEVFSLDEELSIGEVEGLKEYMFSQIGNLAVNGNGNIYVLDRKECQIKVFDRDGKYLQTFGKKGQGPGELNRPSGILITPHNEIMVEDSRTLHFFTLQGGYIKSLSAAKIQFFGRTSMDSQGSIYAMTATMNMEKGASSYELKKFDSNLNFLNTVCPLQDL